MSSNASMRPRLSLVTCEDAFVELEERQRHPPLDSTLELEQFQMHVDRNRELRMLHRAVPAARPFAVIPIAGEARWLHRVGHAEIIHKLLRYG